MELTQPVEDVDPIRLYRGRNELGRAVLGSAGAVLRHAGARPPEGGTMVRRLTVVFIVGTTALVAGAVPGGGVGQVSKSPHGPDDEIGALNALNAARTLAILQRVGSGRLYDLSVETFVGMPGLYHLGMGHLPFQLWMTHAPDTTGVEAPPPGPDQATLYDDAIIAPTHTGTHLDALNHFGYGQRIFNGFAADLHLGNRGWTRAGADAVPPIITRGVLIDVAADRGVAMLPDSYAITTHDLQRALSHQGVTLEQGDAVLIRTGRMTVWPDAERFVPNEPGITKQSAAWLIDEGAVVIGADTMGVEKKPKTEDDVHSYVLAERGVCLLELLWLEDLSRDAVHEFALIAAPIKLRGATGSFVRPLALPLTTGN